MAAILNRSSMPQVIKLPHATFLLDVQPVVGRHTNYRGGWYFCGVYELPMTRIGDALQVSRAIYFGADYAYTALFALVHV